MDDLSAVAPLAPVVANSRDRRGEGKMRIIGLVMLSGLAAATPARSQELAGRFGYLGEWDLAATLSPSAAGRAAAQTHIGALRMKHLALCAPGDASEKTGQISISIRPAVGRADARYSARITLADGECSGTGTLSEGTHSFLDCGAQGRIPLRLWLK